TELRPYAFILSNGVYLPSVPSNLFGTMYVDGSSLTLVGTQVLNGVATGASAVLADGLVGLNLSANIAAGVHLLNVGLQLQFWRDFVRLGVSFIDANTITNTFWAVGAAGSVTAQRDVTDLGEYAGPDADALAAAHGIDRERDGLRRVQLRHLVNKAAYIRAGGGSFNFAALGRADWSRGKQVLFRTMLTNQQARDLVFEDEDDGKGHRTRKYVREKARALGWRPDRLTIPDQHDPDALTSGDEVVVTRSGVFTGSLVVGNLIVFAGVQAFFRADVEVSVHKINPTTVEILYNPTRIHDVGSFVYNPFGPEMDLGRGHAHAYRQSFIFDLTKPSARAAYHEAVEGRLPGALHKYIPAPGHLQGQQLLADMVRDENKRLPEGVTRTYLHIVVSTEHRGGFGAYWRIIPRAVLPRGWLNILATHRNRVHEKQAITDGDVVDAADNRFKQRRNELLWYGLRTVEVAAQRRWLTEKRKRELLGITVEATLYDSCMRGLAGNREFVDRINRFFETDFPHFTRRGHKQQREVDVTQLFTRKDLDALAHFASLWHACVGGAGRPSGEPDLMPRLQAGLAATHLRYSHVVRMLRAVAKASTEDGKADVLQHFVQKEGLRGFALLHRLLRDNVTFFVSTTSSAYADALRRTNRMALKYLHPIRRGEPPATLRRRFDDVAVALRLVRRALHDLADDPFAGDEREALENELHAARETLVQLLWIDPALRPVFVASLHRCPRPRRSGDDTFLLYHLEEAGLWTGRADALVRRFGDVPLPTEAGALLCRWREIFGVACALRARACWSAR
ncbi:MAG TPA: hypothetical protein VFH51_06655, partial [Myxococcota bacterium]|nr:hypothetical protein [Myxococcota bacterium]